jgi:tetratricopeptide (TPR) repeat protein
VESLLPPAGSALLITSRNKFVLPGLKEKDLDVLPLDDAKKLLLEIAGRIGGHADELAELCGCLPLALRNAASVLAEKKNLDVAEYVERLKDARKCLKLVDASFSLSYELLTPELQSLWSLLSVFPANFDRAGAAAVWEMEPDLAEEALGELVKWSLVDFLLSASGECERYHLHDLSRVFADSRLGADAREPAQQRHAKHYQELLWKANELFLLGNLGLAYAALGDPRKAIQYYEQALKISRAIGDQRVEGNSLGSLGNAYRDLGQPDKAIEYHEQALKIARKIGDRRGEGINLFNMIRSLDKLKQRAKAIELAKSALEIFKQIESPNSEQVRQKLDEWQE